MLPVNSIEYAIFQDFKRRDCPYGYKECIALLSQMRIIEKMYMDYQLREVEYENQTTYYLGTHTGLYRYEVANILNLLLALEWVSREQKPHRPNVTKSVYKTTLRGNQMIDYIATRYELKESRDWLIARAKKRIEARFARKQRKFEKELSSFFE